MNAIDFLQLELHEKVGEGSFGSVWRASYLVILVALGLDEKRLNALQLRLRKSSSSRSVFGLFNEEFLFSSYFKRDVIRFSRSLYIPICVMRAPVTEPYKHN